MSCTSKSILMTYPQEMGTGAANSKSEPKAGEQALLRLIRSRAAHSSQGALRLGIGDDCALLRPRRGEELAVTTDLSIAGRHFRLDWHSPESIGHRALARGLSDLAAMGARPVAAFLSLGLPRELTAASGRKPAWMQRFLDGLLALAAIHKTPLAGGDLSESPIAIADIVLIGAVFRGKALLRSTARPGDLLYVTGALGGAAAALARLEELASAQSSSQPPRISKNLEAQLAPHLYPQPRVAQGLWLVRHGLACAAIDLSDGLSTDLAHICDESGVAAEVNAAALPIHPASDPPTGPQRRRRLRTPLHCPAGSTTAPQNRRRRNHANRPHPQIPLGQPNRFASHTARPRAAKA